MHLLHQWANHSEMNKCILWGVFVEQSDTKKGSATVSTPQIMKALWGIYNIPFEYSCASGEF